MKAAADLDQVFWALSDATRRHVIARLTSGGASITELSRPHGMSLPGFMKHLRVLEEAGLLVRAKEGRTVRCELAPRALEGAAMWLAQYEQFWSGRLDALGRYLYHQQEVHPWTDPPKRKRNSASRAATPSPPKKSGKPGPTRKR